MTRIDLVTMKEAAEILGCPVSTVRQFLRDGRLTEDGEHSSYLDRGAVEDLATNVYGWLEHRNDPDPYWMGGERAAATLGVDRATLERLSHEHRLLSILQRDGTTLYRTRDLVAGQHTREARAWSGF